MRGDRRVPEAFYTANVLSHFAFLCACITVTTASNHGIPIEIKLWDTGRTPLAHLVDVTNEFGLKVLAEHNFLNDNNIAFSPYGLMGIMVALYEGVDGEASYQIQRGMQLPWNRNVMRIGFRDIHRTLKTYFVPEEGFLAGLALNNENVTFNDQYKKILRFYGFDLENDQLPTLSPETNNTSNETSATTSTISPASSGDSTTTTAMPSDNQPVRDVMNTPSNREETTTTINPNAETIDTLDIREGTASATSPSSAPNAESTPVASSATETTTSTSVTEMTTQITVTTLQDTVPQTEATTSEPTTVTSTQAITTPAITTQDQTTTTIVPSLAMDTEAVSSASLTMEPEMNTEDDMNMDQMITVEASSSTTQSVAEDTRSTSQSAIDSSTVSSADSIMPSTEVSQQTEQISTMSMNDVSTAINSVTSMANDSTLETLARKKKSIVDFIFTNPPYVDDYLDYRSYDIGPELTKSNFDDKMFLANGLNSIQVTYMHYDTVLEHAYLPHLEASALRLPLDSDRYYLLVILPTRAGSPEIGRLLSRMARESDLSDVYSVLRPRRVKGIVPSFTVKGHVTLTTDLQKLGIRDVFEPRQRDFTPMTKQAGVYVRSIEQAVSVAIRKYRPDDQKKHRYVTNRDPVMFSATYPFLYFVMDANIHVALMAGKMVPPAVTEDLNYVIMFIENFTHFLK